MTHLIHVNQPISAQSSVIGATDPASAAAVGNSGGDTFGSLTPDALMTFCQTRLDSIDSQVGTAFDEQQRQSKQTSDLSKIMHDFQAYSEHGVSNPDKVKTLEQELHSFIITMQKTDPGSPELSDLTQTFNNAFGTGTGAPFIGTDGQTVDFIDVNGTHDVANFDHDSNMGSNEVPQFVQSMQDAISHINSNAQLQMIQVQSLMSQRQTAITLTTNLVQQLGDQSNKIADNIGH